MAELVDTIRDYAQRHPAESYTIEVGRGETYANADWTLYAHGTYPSGSVLAGQPSRAFVASTFDGEAGKQALIAAAREAGIRAYAIDGSTHRPAREVLDAAGLFDGEEGDDW